MNRSLIGIMAAAMASLTAASPGHAQEAPGSKPRQAAKVVVIPVRTQIDKPALYILRRGLKDAITNEVDTVVLDMKTPGGRLDITLEIMEAIDRFPGKTITYVNNEATSAGAIIASVTDEIYFSPKATMGAAEAIMGSGQDISEGLKRKLNSYMGAKIRAYAGKKRLRADVIRAMMEPEFELKIDDKILKPEGELLSLTAIEAMETYGDPPQALLADGIAGSIVEILDRVHGSGNYTIQRLEPSWSENLAHYLTLITPVLLAFGLLGLFVEFKTPGFGVFGITGIVLLAIVFLGHHVAGLAGFEPMLLLLLGLVLIAAEVFLFPGTVIAAMTGAILVLVSLVWTMLDIWPNEPLELSGDILMRPLLDISLGVIGAIALFLAILRFLPQGGPWGQLILKAAVAGEPLGPRPVYSDGKPSAGGHDELVGKTGIAVTDLYPSGQITIDGQRYEAHLDVGLADAGTTVKVIGVSQFGLNVEVVS